MEQAFQIIPAGSSIRATTPYRVVNMDLKKIMALAMMALMVIPSLTVTVGADEDDGVGMACAIERAQIYLDKVNASAEATAAQYEEDPDHVIHGYLSELNDLLGQDWEDSPDFLLQWRTNGIAEESDLESHSGTYSIHLETTGDLPAPENNYAAAEARIVIPMPEGFTLGELNTLSWWTYLVTGSTAHVDIILDLDNDGDYDNDDDALVIQYAYNDWDKHYVDNLGDPSYGAETGAWYKTFSDDGDGPAVITNTTMAWATKGAAGAPPVTANFFFYSLAEWKEGVTYIATNQNEKTIDSDSIVLRLEIEVDNWGDNSNAYIDDIKINKVTYDFEEEPEVQGAKGYLDQALAYHYAGDNKSAARCLASARNILGRINGLLRSMAKTHKVTRTEKFERKFERRIQGIKDKIERQKGPKKDRGR